MKESEGDNVNIRMSTGTDESQPQHSQNSIAFGSAPRREVDSQPFSPCARPAVSHTETHSLGFLSVADASLNSGATLHCRASSGRMVTQPKRNFFGRRFVPWLAAFGAAAAKCRQTRIRTTDRKPCVSYVTIRPAVMCQHQASPLLRAFWAKTFDPPPTPSPHPPPQKVISSFRG